MPRNNHESGTELERSATARSPTLPGCIRVTGREQRCEAFRTDISTTDAAPRGRALSEHQRTIIRFAQVGNRLRSRVPSPKLGHRSTGAPTESLC